MAADELGFYFHVEASSLGEPVHDARRRQAGGPVDLRRDRPHPEVLRQPSVVHPDALRQRAGRHERTRRTSPNGSSHYKAKDPRRLWTSGAGWPQIAGEPVPRHARPAHPGLGRRAEDPHQRPAAGDDAPTTATTSPRARCRSISHEIGQWCVYPNFDEIKKYTGYLKPRNFEIFRDPLRRARHGRPGAAVPARLRQAADALLQGGHRVRAAHAGHGRISSCSTCTISPARARRWSACSIRSGRRRATSRRRNTAASATPPCRWRGLTKRVFTTDETLDGGDRGRALRRRRRSPNAVVRLEAGGDAGETICARGELPAKTIPVDNGIRAGQRGRAI